MNPVDFFDKCRFWGENHSSAIMNYFHVYGVLNRVTDILANLFLPIYFRLTDDNPTHSLPMGNDDDSQKVIVSLTSFPKRMSKLWLVIETLLRQSVKPNEIVLYLQLPDIALVPRKLREQEKRGLRIVLCKETLRSHTKYFHSFQSYSNDIIITVDDDSFYRTDLVECLLAAHRIHPKAIVANWAKIIIPFKYKYTQWPDAIEATASFNMLFIGVSGVLYPPQSLYKDIFREDLIQKLCLTADDVWLTCMALLKHTPFYFTAYEYRHLPVIIPNNETLISVNYERNQICIDNINEYYQKNLGIRPFVDIPIKNINEGQDNNDIES